MKAEASDLLTTERERMEGTAVQTKEKTPAMGLNRTAKMETSASQGTAQTP